MVKPTHTSVAFPKEVHAKLKKYAELNYMPMTKVIEKLVDEANEREK